MGVLSLVNCSDDVRALDETQLDELSGEILEILMTEPARADPGPLRGVVALTIALHRVFDSAQDRVIFDAGQACAHRVLTDRTGFACGLQASPHASASLSYADGLAKAFGLTRQSHRHVAAVVGGDALTGGMCWEALTAIAGGDRPVVVVVNDNDRDYTPPLGGPAHRLALDGMTMVRTAPEYERLLGSVKSVITGVPLVGGPAYSLLHAVKTGLKDAVTPQALFGDLGIKYIGPVDGNDHGAVESALLRAKLFGGPVIVHTVTGTAVRSHRHRGHGDERSWAEVVADELTHHARIRPDIVAVTVAGAGAPATFAREFPDRTFDVAAEQHAVASAAGLALGGLHPVVAAGSTMVNRAFDQALMDVGLLQLPVTFVLDRSGVTGPCAGARSGVWDLAMLGMIPGARVAAPRDAASLRDELGEALAHRGGPTALRYPTGDLHADIAAIDRIDGVDVLYRPQATSAPTLLIVIGAFARPAVAAAQRLGVRGVGMTVVDPRWVLPVPDAIVALAAEFRLVVTLEDGSVHGGVGSAVSARLRDAGIDVPVRNIGVPHEFIDPLPGDRLPFDLGLTAPDIADRITGWIRTLDVDVVGW